MCLFIGKSAKSQNNSSGLPMGVRVSLKNAFVE